MKTKQLLLILLTALFPLAVWSNVWQDPETKVNYEYHVGSNDATVKNGSYSSAGSPDATGDITILSRFTVDGKDYAVNSIGQYAFCKCTGISSVTIPSTVTNMGKYAFKDCTGLTSVTLSDGVSYIGEYAFSRCTSLSSITIPSSVTNMGKYAFQDCTGLTSVTLSEGVSYIGECAFWGCI